MAVPASNIRMGLVLSRLDGVKVAGDGWVSRCPAHDDTTPSMTISLGDDERILVCCQAGCTFESICEATGLSPIDFFPPSEAMPKPTQDRTNPRPCTLEEMRSWKSTRAVYDYQDENGKSLYVVRRHVDDDGKKTFRQYRAVGGGRYAAKLLNTRRVLYRLPELIEAVSEGRPVWVVEGEKDVETLRALGLDATCNVGGAKKWPDNAARLFKSADVVVCEDNDEPGVEHARMVAASLAPVAASIRVLRLPNLPPHGDVSDWIANGGTRDQLLQLVAGTTTREAGPSDAPVEYHMTDWGNAQRLRGMFGDRIRYCRPAKNWYIWDGRRWALDRIGQIERYCKETVRQMYDEATAGSTDRRLVDWALKSESHARLIAMAATAQTEPGIDVLPEQLDADPWMVNCQNGTLDLRTGRLSPHDRRQLITKMAPVSYDPKAQCPLWESTLHRLMDGQDELTRYLQRVAGYSLTGSTRENAMFIAYGLGANGKSTVLNALREIMGDYAKQAQFSTFEVQKNDRVRDDIADLKGARMVCAGEGERGARLAEAVVKSLTGGDPVKARFLFQSLFEFIPEFKLILASNHKPTIRGTDNGIWRRIRLIPFTVTLPKEQWDKELPHKLRAERDGIFAWMVRGCMEWQRTGLDDPAQVLAATEDYRDEMDKLGPFFSDYCVLGAEHSTYADSLYQAYVQWAKVSCDEVMSAQSFARRLRDRDCKPFRKVENSKTRRAWSGIALRADESPARQQPPAQGTIWDQPEPTHWTDTYLA